jgi:hypothetical protein
MPQVWCGNVAVLSYVLVLQREQSGYNVNYGQGRKKQITELIKNIQGEKPNV